MPAPHQAVLPHTQISPSRYGTKMFSLAKGLCAAILLLLFVVLCGIEASAQVGVDTCGVSNAVIDSLIIAEVEDVKGPEKVLHAEPLYIDLIRDLGARKGEAEWNVGWGMTDRSSHIAYEGLIEYEWAPMDRLGLEVEVPFYLYSGFRNGNAGGDPIPSNRLDGLKVAAQYSFYVSEKHQTSLAAGYLHTWKFPTWRDRNFSDPNRHVLNPFVVGARRWGNNWHTLIYTGPVINKPTLGPTTAYWGINTSVHYMITGTRNFIGLEVNKELDHHELYGVARPQLRLCITDNLLIGILTSIPLSEGKDRFGSFLRLIYEPKHK